MSGVDEDLVASAVIALLRAEMPTGVLVGDGAAPYVDTATEPVETVDPATGESMPYLVVWVIAPAQFLTPGYAGQDGSETVRFQLTGVGAQRDAAHGCAVVATGILVDRLDGPDDRSFVHDLVVAGHSVIDRRKVERGPIVAEGGTWNAPMIVDVWVHRTS